MISDDIIFLLGAGASRDAGLKTSDEMTEELERLLEGGWSKYKRLYNAVKAGILYGYALKGIPQTNVNIEEFVNVLTELSQCKDHTIFPFIASWNMELMETAGEGFDRIIEFRSAIVKELVEKWVKLEDSGCAYYYRMLQYFANDLGSNLRVFSLNYDMCVEQGCTPDSVFTGFVREGDRKGRIWNDRMMSQDDLVSSPVRLYKLHGSVDWRNEGGVLVSYDSPKPCDNANDYQLIFGTRNKMRYTEPYLYLLSEFRRATFAAKLIVCVGYSFQDDHINSILHHAFMSESPTKLLHVGWHVRPKDAEVCSEVRKRIADAIQVGQKNVEVVLEGAKAFMEKQLKVAEMEAMLAEDGLLF